MQNLGLTHDPINPESLAGYGEASLTEIVPPGFKGQKAEFFKGEGASDGESGIVLGHRFS